MNNVIKKYLNFSFFVFIFLLVCSIVGASKVNKIIFDVKADTIQPANSAIVDNWTQIKPLSPLLTVTQSSLAYDARDNVLFAWGGHLYGGAYPQMEELFIYDIAQNKWRVQHPLGDRPPNYCVANDNVYDEANGVFVKLGGYEYGTHQWMRNIYLKDKVHTYDFLTNKWTKMYNTVVPSINPAHGAAYDSDNQIVFLWGGQGSTMEGTWVYDVYTNTWTQMLGWSKSPTWTLPTGQKSTDRNSLGLAYDKEHHKIVLYGGGSRQTDTWVYDIGENKWTEKKPDKSPSAATGGSYNTVIGPAVAYDSLNKKVLAFIPIYCSEYESQTSEADCKEEARRFETWAYDMDENTWIQMSTRPSTSVSHRAGDTLTTFMPEHNAAFVMELGSGEHCPPGATMCSEFWTYQYGAPETNLIPEPPTNLSVETTGSKATLNWTASPSSNLSGYNVYRGIGERPWEVSYSKINASPIIGTSFVDTQSISSGNIYFYYIRAINNANQESEDSIKVRTQPQIIKEAVVSVMDISHVEIDWQASLENDVVGYNIYRAEASPGICKEGEKPTDGQHLNNPLENFICPRAMVYHHFHPGTFSKINTALITGTTYTDNINLDNSGGDYPYKVYAYIVKAVNKLNIESGPSPYWPTIPGAPVQVKYKDATDKIYLQWAANSEKNIQGYRVYRKGPSYNYWVTELTENPITSTSFVHNLNMDSGCNKDTDPDCYKGNQVSYYITAVDALGQDGVGSARALIRRQDQVIMDQYHYLDGQYIMDFQVITSSLTNGEMGIAYSQSLSAVGGTFPYSWTVSSGSLPAGLSLDSSSGLISGTPSALGTYNFTSRVTDASYEIVTKLLTITISEVQDHSAPQLSAGSPSGELSSETIQTNIALTTNEVATCKYSTVANTSYGSMENTFTTTGATSHSIGVAGLISGNTYNYYARCVDGNSNVNTSDYLISFSIAKAEELDISAPVISNINVNDISDSAATITWQTDEVANSLVEYGLTPARGQTSVLDNTLVAPHSVMLAGLESNKTYHFKVISNDEAGNSAESNDRTFKTEKESVDDITPPTGSVKLKDGVSLTDNPVINLELLAEDLSGVEEMKISEKNNINQATAEAFNTLKVWILSLKNELKTIYVWFKDTVGNWNNEPYSTTTTLDTVSADIKDVEIENVTETSAQIKWKTDEATHSQVKYGLTASYGEETSLGALLLEKSVSLENLSGNTTYHFRIDAEDEAGNASQSIDYEFTTVQGEKGNDITPPAKIEDFAAQNITQTSLELLWTAPGDDGNTGTASAYDIRYFKGNITEGNWKNAEELTGELIPSKAGTTESAYITVGLEPNKTHTFGIKSKDEADNWSELSNVLEIKTQPLSLTVLINAIPSEGEEKLEGVTLDAQIEGTAIGDINYYFYCDWKEEKKQEEYSHKAEGKTETTYTAKEVCNYSSFGNYKARVLVERGGVTAENYVMIKIKKKVVAPGGSDGDSGSSIGGGGGGSSSGTGDGGLYKDTTPPAQPSRFRATPAEKQIVLTWQNPKDSDFVRVKILRKLGSAPTSINDKDSVLIYEGEKEEYTDIKLNNSTTYYYGIFTYDKKPNYSNILTISASPKAGQNTVPKPVNNSENKYKGIKHLYGLDKEIVELISGEESEIIFGYNHFLELTEKNRETYNKVIEKYSDKLALENKYSITKFIQEGTETTIRLGSGERAGVINSYISAFNKYPQTTSDWQDIIKIANGRWTNERNQVKENEAKEIFTTIYKRTPDMNNANDNAAITVITYGLRPVNRNLESEKAGIKTFRNIYKYAPTSAVDWDTVRAISYSGAKR